MESVNCGPPAWNTRNKGKSEEVKDDNKCSSTPTKARNKSAKKTPQRTRTPRKAKNIPSEVSDTCEDIRTFLFPNPNPKKPKSPCSNSESVNRSKEAYVIDHDNIGQDTSETVINYGEGYDTVNLKSPDGSTSASNSFLSASSNFEGSFWRNQGGSVNTTLDCECEFEATISWVSTPTTKQIDIIDTSNREEERLIPTTLNFELESRSNSVDGADVNRNSCTNSVNRDKRRMTEPAVNAEIEAQNNKESEQTGNSVVEKGKQVSGINAGSIPENRPQSDIDDSEEGNKDQIPDLENISNKEIRDMFQQMMMKMDGVKSELSTQIKSLQTAQQTNANSIAALENEKIKMERQIQDNTSAVSRIDNTAEKVDDKIDKLVDTLAYHQHLISELSGKMGNMEMDKYRPNLF